ncbi:hypothetical protein D3C81_1854770 [compost metagenome]
MTGGVTGQPHQGTAQRCGIAEAQLPGDALHRPLGAAQEMHRGIQQAGIAQGPVAAAFGLQPAAQRGHAER